MAIPSVYSLLKKYGIFPKKRLGQHFLAAMPTIEKIVAALDICQDDVVIEIGPGLGVMTGLVAAQARHVVAIERDAAVLDIAKAELAERANITWIHGDVLEQTMEGVSAAAGRKATARYKIIGNLPYNISSPILFWMLDNRERLECAVVMLQKEVAVRIAAKPGGRDYGILSVLTQAFAKPSLLFHVSAKSFVPPPEVTSSVLRLDFYAKSGLDAARETRFRELVRAAFGKRRKTIRNALLGARGMKIEPSRLDMALADAGIDHKRRPETLSVDEFFLLTDALNDSCDQ